MNYDNWQILQPRPVDSIHMLTPNWGTIPQCPHCPATNITRRSPQQKTCGALKCRNARRQAIKRP